MQCAAHSARTRKRAHKRTTQACSQHKETPMLRFTAQSVHRCAKAGQKGRGGGWGGVHKPQSQNESRRDQTDFRIVIYAPKRGIYPICSLK